MDYWKECISIAADDCGLVLTDEQLECLADSVEGGNVMRITTQKGMVNIDNKEIAYGNIRKMYTAGNGQGLQLSTELEPKRGEIISICAEIADRIYKLQDILARIHRQRSAPLI